jgi:hypothetical protein
MQAMSEIIHFQQQMRFGILRHYSASYGVGAVVAVFFFPAAGNFTHSSAPPANEAVTLRLVDAHAAPTKCQQ